MADPNRFVTVCQMSTNAMKPMNVIQQRPHASMSLEPTAAIVYPDSTVPLVANLATVAIRRYVVLICTFFHSEVEEELAFYSTP